MKARALLKSCALLSFQSLWLDQVLSLVKGDVLVEFSALTLQLPNEGIIRDWVRNERLLILFRVNCTNPPFTIGVVAQNPYTTKACTLTPRC